ncbi:UNVERIFIED_CONTAM: hypothetical protein NCL1_22949 [Trichonephila clavipes]
MLHLGQIGKLLLPPSKFMHLSLLVMNMILNHTSQLTIINNYFFFPSFPSAFASSISSTASESEKNIPQTRKGGRPHLKDFPYY